MSAETIQLLEQLVRPIVEKILGERGGAAPEGNDDEGITADEAARLIGVKPWRVYEMIRRGVLPAYRPSPQRLRIRLSAVREFMRSEEVSHNGNQ